MIFSLTILGSSSALPTSKRFPTAHLLNVNERFFLIDCGEGTQIQLRKLKLGFGKLNHIFISHVHGDHVFGLFGLLSSFQLLGRKSALHIHGPEELQKMISFYLENFSGESQYPIHFHSIGHRSFHLIHEDKHVEVFSIPLKHRTPTIGFLFREKKAELNLRKDAMDIYKPLIEDIKKIKLGEDLLLSNGEKVPNSELTLPPWKQRSYAYISDTAMLKGIVNHIRGVDLLYHESTFESKDEDLAKLTFHSTSKQAAEIAKAAGVKKLLLGHFSSRYKTASTIEKEAREIFPPSATVNDGDVFSVERERENALKINDTEW